MATINQAFLEALPHQEHNYVNTKFRIDAGYRMGVGMSLAQHDRFYAELKECFAKAGWDIKEPATGRGCPTVHKGGNELYCHPMEISGPCEPSLFSEVEGLLRNAETFRLIRTDTFERVYDISDKQYREALDAVRSNVEQDLMAAFSTRHPREFINGRYDRIDGVAGRYNVSTLTKPSGLISSGDVHMKYVNEVFQDLVKEEKIVCKDNEQGSKSYRSLSGPEMLEKARKEASLSVKIQDAQARANSQTIPRNTPEIRREPPDSRT